MITKGFADGMRLAKLDKEALIVIVQFADQALREWRVARRLAKYGDDGFHTGEQDCEISGTH